MRIIATRLSLIVGSAALVLFTLCVFQTAALATTSNATIAQGDPDRPVVLGQVYNPRTGKPKANVPHPELVIKQFLFPPANDKALRVQVANKGKAASGPVLIYLGTGETNNAAGRARPQVKAFSSLAAGTSVWIDIDASSILPRNVSLQSKNFKLNVYSAEIIAESGKTEVRHAQLEFTAATPTSAQRRRIIEGYSAEFYAGGRLESGNKEKPKAIAAQPEESRDSFYGSGVYKSTDAGKNANSQADEGPTEKITFVYGTLSVAPANKANRVEILVQTPDRQKFLADPVNAFNRQGKRVPTQAETHWRAVSLALRRLTNPYVAQTAGSSRSQGVETLTYKIHLREMPGVVLTIVGDWNGDGTTTGARRFDSNKFFADPVATLRALGVNVRTADERDWRQLAAALRELQHVYSTIRVMRNAEGQQEAPRGFNERIELESAQLATTGEDPKRNQPQGWISAGPAPQSNDSRAPSTRIAKIAKPDLIINNFLFPPTNDKALRVQVANTGHAASGAGRLVLTIRRLNGVAVGRTTHVNVPALAVGAEVWLLIDVKSILPVNVSLKATTFKLNVDATEIVAESDESNNEVWHNQ